MSKPIGFLTELGIKYVSFADYPAFGPMFNPREALELGIYGGIFQNDAYAVGNNHFGVESDHQSYWPMMRDWYNVEFLGKYTELAPPGLFTPSLWFEWYRKMYEDPKFRPENPELNKLMIAWWRRAVYYTSLSKGSFGYTVEEKQCLLDLC